MPNIVKSGNSAHDATCFTAHQTYQATIDAAGGPAASQATVNTATITLYRALRTSAIANGLVEGQVEFWGALRSLNALP